MAWRGGRYYQGIRVGSRVITRYYGNGELARLAARDDQERIRRRRARWAEAKALKDHHLRALEAERARALVVRHLVVIGLESLGFVRCSVCNPWRRPMRPIDG